MSTRPRLALAAATLALVVGAGALVPAAQAQVSPVERTPAPPGVVAAAAHAINAGRWVALAHSTGSPSATPAVWTDPQGRAWVLWPFNPTSTTATYEAAAIAPNGSLAVAAADVLGGKDWAGVSGEPTLVGQGGHPLVVFNGGDGINGSKYDLSCIYGALRGTTSWTVQPWSLSNDCVNPVGAAAANAAGTVAAAWPGGWATGHGVLYRIGTSATIPATGTDQHIAIGSGDGYKAGIASDTAGNGHFWVAWARSGSGSTDGMWAQDVTSHGVIRKAPGSGTNTITRIGPFANLAVASTNTHAGVYLAYCSNSATTCTEMIWRVGAAKALAVPRSAGGYDVAISAGPSGRLWVAWYNETTNKVSVVRTNRAVTAFGAVHTYATPCAEHGLLGLSSGSLPKVDIVLQCLNNSLHVADYYTQSGVSLQVHLSKSHLHAGAKHRVKVRVTDAGDPIAGAMVRLGHTKVRTNSKGLAKLVISAHLSAKSYHVTARKSGYGTGVARLRLT